MNQLSRITLLLASIVVLTSSACAPKRKGTAAPADAAAAEAPGEATFEDEAPPPQSFEELEARLSQYEAQALASGVPLPAAPAVARDDAGAEAQVGDEGGVAEGPEGYAQNASRCERVCDLAEAICGLESKICDMADRHPTERRYAETCARAESDCDRASAACTDC